MRLTTLRTILLLASIPLWTSVASAASTQSGDYVSANGPGRLVVRGPDGTTWSDTASSLNCRNNGDCLPRVNLPAGKAANGEWAITLYTDNTFLWSGQPVVFNSWRITYQIAGFSGSTPFKPCVDHLYVVWKIHVSDSGTYLESARCVFF